MDRSDHSEESPGAAADQDLQSLPDHPRGTLAILFIYATLFVVGWAAFYVFIFLARGATTH